MGLVGAGALALALAAAFCPSVAGIPVEFGLFALTLIGVAVLHHYTLPVALTGLSTVALYKMIFTGFKAGTGLVGFALHMEHEWVMLTNLFCLLTGFAILSRHFEKSHVPVVLPKYLPDDWKGGFVLLCMVFVLSSFLDNIAAAMIGGTMAHQLFKGRVTSATLPPSWLRPTRAAQAASSAIRLRP
jgi:Na+/H+ antiporter NhaD/arsenite permease-like protein